MIDTQIDFDDYADIPGITPEKLKALHEKHIAGRSRNGNAKKDGNSGNS